MKKRKMSFADEVRQAVRDSGVSQYRIRIDTGLDRAALSRFMASKRFLQAASLNKLAAYLDLHVVRGMQVHHKKPRKRRSP